MMIINRFSVRSCLLEMIFNGVVISSGTCFFWLASGVPFLVTNWHNVTGVNPVTGANLDAKGGSRPDGIRAGVFKDRDPNKPWKLTLDLTPSGVPIWYEHPVHGRQVDVVCIPLPHDAAAHVFSINDEAEDKVRFEVAAEVYILGYPLGLSPHGLPIWKKASIASEPDIDIDYVPKVLVDTATISGMSGSPVIFYSNESMMENGERSTMLGGKMTRLLGIYSGRVGTGIAGEAQLGIVWKAHLIDEIIAGRKSGSLP